MGAKRHPGSLGMPQWMRRPLTGSAECVSERMATFLHFRDRSSLDQVATQRDESVAGQRLF